MGQARGTGFDAVIVGAGPAGSATAIELARAGWAVALVEKQRFPRRKVCGECLAASNLVLLHRLGVGEAFEACAGPELRQVSVLRGNQSVTAALPAAELTVADRNQGLGHDQGHRHHHHRWGRALGRETLDTLLLEQARRVGVEVLQPWSVQAIEGQAGAWHCELRAQDTTALRRVRASLVIDAHGSWEDLPAQRPQRRLARDAADLFAFKANFHGAALAAGAISVLALDGGYGGMVVADGGVTTVACCVRRDRLSGLRAAAPGMGAGDAVQAWLQRECGGLGEALHAAVRDGAWLACGPIHPGLRIGAADRLFSVGNAAGEAHPILGEGMSMALQSAALLCSHLLAGGPARQAPAGPLQAALQRRYAVHWRREFVPRMRLAAAFAQLAMRPPASAALMTLLQAWPGLLTHGARWGGKVRLPELVRQPDPGGGALPAHAPPEPVNLATVGDVVRFVDALVQCQAGAAPSLVAAIAQPAQRPAT